MSAQRPLRPSSKALVPSSQPVPHLELVTRYHPVELVNCYQVLGNISKPNYTSA